jgi:hypothetical protein
MEEVIILQEVEDEIFNLIETLYKNEYFSLVESAEVYVLNIIDFIYSIPTLKRKLTADSKFGKYYCTFKHNDKTSWYISFYVEEGLYNIKNVTNNHTEDYPKFIKKS